MNTAAQTDVNTLSFEQALDELEKIVKELESGQPSLDNAISFYERGTALKKHCEKTLNEAKMKIDRINFKEDGTATLEEEQ